MPVNSNRTERWKEDSALSVDTYNAWFMKFAPKTYREARVGATKEVEMALTITKNMTDMSPKLLKEHPGILPILRMSTAPPIARDRVIGLAGVSRNLVTAMEKHKRVPSRLITLEDDLVKIGVLIKKLVDKDIFVWLDDGKRPTDIQILRASTIVADRLCGASSDPIIRNAQEARQRKLIGQWLDMRRYKFVKAGEGLTFDKMLPGTYAFHLNIPITQRNNKRVNIPVDVAVRPKSASHGDFPLFIEAKSAGDFTNTNKRRKEEATKIAQLKATYGESIRYVLFLCGYFDTGYLGYEAAEGIDWVWEHRIDDLAEFGV